MNILKGNTGSERFKDDWRMARIQVLRHIRLSQTWSDIMQGVDVLAYIDLKAKPLIAEQEMFSDAKVGFCCYEGCEEDAEWRIWFDKYLASDGCSRHIIELISDGHDSYILDRLPCNNKEQFDDVKVGTKLWHIRCGWVTVTQILETGNFPIVADIEGGAVTFAKDGRQKTLDLNPTLFWDEVKIVPPERPNRCLECNDVLYYKYDVCTKCLIEKEKAERPEEHIHRFTIPLRSNVNLNEILSYSCECGASLRPKEECEACELIADTDGYVVRGTHVDAIYRFLLNQHHTCEKKDA